MPRGARGAERGPCALSRRTACGASDAVGTERVPDAEGRGAAERAADPCVLIKRRATDLDRRATDLDRRSPRAHGDGKGASANALRVTHHRGNARRNSGGVLLHTRRRGHNPGHRSRDLWVVAGGDVKRLGLRPHKNLYVGVCV